MTDTVPPGESDATRRERGSPGARRPFLWLTALAIGLLLAGSAGFVWRERQQALQQAEALAARRASRLAQDIFQSLNLARRAIDLSERLAQADSMGPAALERLVSQRTELLSVLPLPFELRALEADYQSVDLATSLARRRLSPDARTDPAQDSPTHWAADTPTGHVLSMSWPLPHPEAGMKGYSAEFALQPLQHRLEQDRAPPGGATALFRLDPDDRVTVLVRAPQTDGQIGRQLGGWLAQTLKSGEQGVFATPGQLDGVGRRTAFKRLPAPADHLVVAYGFAVDDVLDDWSRTWPWIALASALLSLTLGWVGWRLDRSQAKLFRSEQRLRLALASGQVWEWDLRTRILNVPETLWRSLGYPLPAPHQRIRVFRAAMDPDDQRVVDDRLRRHFRDREPLKTEFRLRDAGGTVRWFAVEGQADWSSAGRATYVAGTVFETTKRHQLEEEQRQILQHLDTVANASAALAWTIDANKHPDWLNQPWLKFTGRDLQIECETPWLVDLHPEDQQRCEKIFDEAFKARRPYSMEYRLRRHDGQFRWLHEQGKPRYDADNRFIGYVGSCLDVTDLRDAEASARERGAMLKQVFDVLKDMLFVVDTQERFVFFQAGSEARLYRRPEDFLGYPMGEVMPPDLVSRLRTAMQHAREGGAQELDYSLDMPTGTHHFNARLAWLPEGEQCMFLVRDTTEQQTINREKERLNDFVLLLFRLASRFINLPLEQMDDAIDDALGDMGEFVSADRVYLFSYDHLAQTATNTHEWCAAGVVPQKPQWQAVPIGRMSDWYRQHLRGERVQVADVQALPANALRELLEAFDIRSLLTLPLMHGSECLGFIGFDLVHRTREYGSEELTMLELFAQMLVNMRLRAEAAEQVREVTGRLEQKVADRTQQLKASVERLQAVNRELESFNYSASHDLRTPLRGIEGFSTLLIQEHAEQLDEQGRDYLQRIQRATLHMSQLVNDLLAYSRLQQLTEHVEPVDISEAVRSVLGTFLDELTARQGEVVVDIPSDLRVRADPQGMAIVLRNLLDNALKFTPHTAAPSIRIEAFVEGGRVQLSVSDRGIGFDMRHHDRIFGMFERLHRQDQIPGTGIGLALVHKAVERMGGHISAEGTPGRGAVFRIDLPAA